MPNLYLKGGALTNNFQPMQQDGTAPADAFFATGTGWISGANANAQMSELRPNTVRARTTFAATVVPTALTTGANANAFRSPNAYNGVFANTTWSFNVQMRATVAQPSSLRLRWRVFASTDPTGATNVRELTAAVILSASGTFTTTANTALNATWSPGVLTLNNEYLFFACAQEMVTLSGTGNTRDSQFRENANSVIVTPAFAPFLELDGSLLGSGYYAAQPEISRLLAGALTGAGSYAGAVEVERALSGFVGGAGSYAGALEEITSYYQERRVEMSDLTAGRQLKPGADLQTIRAQVAKVGSGANPQFKVEILRAGSQTVIATIIDSPVSSTTGELLTGTWNASILGAAQTGEDIELRFSATGSPTGKVRVDAIDWMAAHEVAAPVVTLSGSLNGSGYFAATPEVSRLLSGAFTGASYYAGALEVSRLLSGSLNGSGTYAGAIEVVRALSGYVGGAGSYAGAIQIIRNLSGSLNASGYYVGELEGVVIPVLLAGSLNGTGSYAGALEVSRLFTGSVTASGTYSAAPEVARLLGGSLLGSGDLRSALEVARLLSGELRGGGDFRGLLAVERRLSGALVGFGDLLGEIEVAFLVLPSPPEHTIIVPGIKRVIVVPGIDREIVVPALKRTTRASEVDREIIVEAGRRNV